MIKFNFLRKRLKGFTIIELLVVITIIGILTSSVTFAAGKANDKARDARRKEDLKNLSTALKLYYLDFGSYPESGVDGEATSSEGANWIPGLVPTYIKELPKDPTQAGIISTLAKPAGSTIH